MWFLAIPVVGWLVKMLYQTLIHMLALVGIVALAYMVKSYTFHVDILKPGGWHTYVQCVNKQADNLWEQRIKPLLEQPVSGTAVVSSTLPEEGAPVVGRKKAE